MLKQTTYDILHETIYETKIDNGLTVFLLPKREFAKTYALFTTDYGSIDHTFIPVGENEKRTVPDGIAHFLEHKLFEKKEIDIFAQFLKYGASPNAYTSFTKTAYLFQATKNAKKNVELLLDFVQEPYFSEESVEKEKGIIAEEIKMYDDDVNWQSYMGTINNMFVNHPITVDIAGTIKSIQQITKDDLYTCYNTFYHPENMSLFVTGNFSPNEMIDHIARNQAKKQFPTLEKIKRFIADEPNDVKQQTETLTHHISIPKVTIGIKESTTQLRGDMFIKQNLLQSMTLDYLFSSSGPYYEVLYEENLIDASFSYSTTLDKSFGFSLLSTNSYHPDLFIQKLTSLLLEVNTLTISEAVFQRMKKKRIGQIIRMMNSLQYIANQFIHYHLVQVNFFKVIDYINELSLDDLNNFLTYWIDEHRLTSLIIE